jgi:hypothetical protein
MLLAACGGPRTGGDDSRIEPGKEKLIDALTLFVEAVQGDRFDQAMAYLTPGEQASMLEGNGSVTPAIQRRLKALRLSTLASKPGVRLARGKLEGIYPWLPNVEHTPGPAAGEIPPPLP